VVKIFKYISKKYIAGYSLSSLNKCKTEKYATVIKTAILTDCHRWYGTSSASAVIKGK